MIESIFTRERIRSHLAESPMGEHLPALIQTLRTQRYAPDTIRRYVHAAATFGQWLTTQPLPVSAINEHVLARYIVSRGSRMIRTTGRAQRPQSTVGLHHLLQVLRDQGVIAPPVVAVPTTPIEQVLVEYEQYLDRVHGAARLTRRKYRYFARQLLQAVFPSGDLHWPALRAETITHVVQQETTRRRGFGRKHPGSAIRIFLRYLVTCGMIPAGLEAAVPGMWIWTHASLPEYFSEEEIARLLTVSADGTAVGKRNYALLLLLARLGLRAQEAVHLRLDDIDWRAGIVSVCARKTHRERVLPLPEDVGEALVAYLRVGRPPTTSRAIFLTHTAPYRPLQSESAVTKLVKRLIREAGLCRRTSGAHLFRHAAATHMVRRGVSFKAVADVLGHQSLQTTGIYAKLDLETLAQVALPWPGGAQ